MFQIIAAKSKSKTSTRAVFLVATAIVAPLLLSGCLVGGVSSRGGVFVWPGGLGLLLIVALLFFFLRRGR